MTDRRWTQTEPESDVVALVNYANLTEEGAAKARQKELDQLWEFDVYEIATRAEAYDDGATPISTRWVDVLKGDGAHKSRLVAKQFNQGDVLHENYSPTPSSTTARIVEAVALSKGLSIVYLDVSVAFLHANVPAGQYLYAVPPPDSNVDKDKCWRLKKMLYGTRAAPKAWSDHLCAALLSHGFARGRTDPCYYTHGERNLHIVAHVDDMMLAGPQQEIEALVKKLGGELALKSTDLMQRGNNLLKVCFPDWETGKKMNAAPTPATSATYTFEDENTYAT